jgi:16S rRNA (guanine527-N7)-methyltransferase
VFSDLPTDQAALLDAHFRLLGLWNRKLNLTTEDSVERHYGESVFLARHLPAGAWRIVDIGSGPGFPGFPVAVLRPECSVTLVESHQRKAVFLKEATRGLKNVRVRAVRAEAVTDTYDWAISRAVSYEDLARCLPRLAPRVALLTGGAEPIAALGYTWEEPIALTGSTSRFLRIGSVSRETPCFT